MLFAQITTGLEATGCPAINPSFLTMVVAAVVSTVAAKETVAADVFTLKSATFEDGKMMPKKVANSAANTQNNPNCVGDNVSPEFSWSNVPEGTESFVMLMTDPEGRGGAGVVHWIAYGIPISIMGFAEDNGPPVHAKGDAGLVGLFVNPWRQ
jgi:phosphatidylethanolamine-binding protein (PEBP) family uncharacterized protein